MCSHNLFLPESVIRTLTVWLTLTVSDTVTDSDTVTATNHHQNLGQYRLWNQRDAAGKPPHTTTNHRKPPPEVEHENKKSLIVHIFGWTWPKHAGIYCQSCRLHDFSIYVFTTGEYKPWTNHGRNMDDPWTTGFYSSGAALASRFIAQALRGLIHRCPWASMAH